MKLKNLVEAMKEELKALYKNNTWILVEEDEIQRMPVYSFYVLYKFIMIYIPTNVQNIEKHILSKQL